MSDSPTRDGDRDPTELVVFDLDGVPRGKWVSARKLASARARGLGFCNVVFGWDAADAPYDNTVASGWHTGYPDAACRLDADAPVRLLPHGEDPARRVPVVVGDFAGGDLEGVCPRAALRRVLAEADGMGLTAVGGFEYEWFNFEALPTGMTDVAYGLSPKPGSAPLPRPITGGMHGYSLIRPAQRAAYYRALWDNLHAADLPLEGLHTETGPGVYEAALAKSRGLEIADRAALFKLAVKRTATAHGLTAGFMAKWHAGLPGCSGHLHLSLVDADGRNVLTDPNDADGLSARGRHALAGLLHGLPALTAVYAPTVNSYKRLVPGSWAATSVSWGHDNRTCALRVVRGQNPSGADTRVEVRLPGADAHPHLVLATAVACALDGIRRARPLELPPVTGNAYEADGLTPLPTNLAAATAAMRAGQEACAELLGGELVDHFLRTRHWEWRRYEAAVTDWERERYLEVI